MVVIELFRSPVIENQEVGLGKRFEDLAVWPVGIAPARAANRNPMLGDGEIFAAGLVAESKPWLPSRAACPMAAAAKPNT